jgi:hypothetical protein
MLRARSLLGEQMTTLPEIVGEFISDAITMAGEAAKVSFPGAAIAGRAVARYLKRCREAARDILMDELRCANISGAQAASEDDAVEVIYRYLSAAQQGAARLNLRLLAKVIVGQFEAGRLVADEFLQFAEVLASLSRDEIIVIGTMYRAWCNVQQQARERPTTVSGIDPWDVAKRELSTKGWNDDRAITAATRSQRSGLLTSKTVYGGQAFVVSPMLIELGATVDFDDALRSENPVPPRST